jgi:hypothetical protein
VKIGEAQAFLRQLIEVGRLGALSPITPHIAVAQIIGDDQDDVRAFPFGAANPMNADPDRQEGDKTGNDPAT